MTNPLKTEHALDWGKTAQEIEDQFQAGMIERDRFRGSQNRANCHQREVNHARRLFNPSTRIPWVSKGCI